MSIHKLAPGQRELIGHIPRFGLPRYLRAVFDIAPEPTVTVRDSRGKEVALTRNDLDAIPEVSMEADMHCVMTWSAVGTRWTGWRMVDVWRHVLRDTADPTTSHVVFTGLDQAMASIALPDLLREDVMIAHTREGEPLDRDHGAPYRLVVPHLYGYKHVKHLDRIELSDHHVASPHEPWIMHPRTLVADEERSGIGPQRLTRAVNRLFVPAALRSAGGKRPRFR